MACHGGLKTRFREERGGALMAQMLHSFLRLSEQVCVVNKIPTLRSRHSAWAKDSASLAAKSSPVAAFPTTKHCSIARRNDGHRQTVVQVASRPLFETKCECYFVPSSGSGVPPFLHPGNTQKTTRACVSNPDTLSPCVVEGVDEAERTRAG